MRAGRFLPSVAVFLLAVIFAVEPNWGAAPQDKGKGKWGKDADPAEYFAWLAGERDHVFMSEIKGGKKELELFAAENSITDGKLTREQFLRYWSQRDDLKQRRKEAKAAQKKAEEEAKKAAEPLTRTSGLEAPDPNRPAAVYHFGDKPPQGLPPWFGELDTDRDGQVSLYEWRMGKKAVDEFVKMDRNDDGLLTAEEVLFYLRQTAARVRQPSQIVVIAGRDERPPMPETPVPLKKEKKKKDKKGDG